MLDSYMILYFVQCNASHWTDNNMINHNNSNSSDDF